MATLTENLTGHDRKVFEAAAITHAATGVPILTHTEGGRGGFQQVETLIELGVAPERVALSHTDKVVDSAYHRDLLSAGVFLSYDQALRRPEDTAYLVVSMVDAGFGNQILLGTDGARRTLWSALRGTPGLAWLRTGFVDQLRAHGMGPEQIDDLFIANPVSFLALHQA